MTHECFDPLLYLVLKVLQEKYLAKFLESPLYRRYLQVRLTKMNDD